MNDISVDLAIDPNTGDLIMAPNGDIDIKTGDDLVRQRMRVRMRVIRGEWVLDFTDSTLGSTLRDSLRSPLDMSMEMIPLMVREALAPMDDIDIVDVQVAQNPTHVDWIDVGIEYRTIDSDDYDTTTITVAG